MARDVRTLLLAAFLAAVPSLLGADSITVDTTADTIDADGFCSLRGAIEVFSFGESDPDCEIVADASGTNLIAFSIPGAGPHTIQVQSELPPLELEVGSIVLDGTTQPGSSCPDQLQIVLDGSSLMAGEDGLEMAGLDNSTIRGLVIQNFPGAGIALTFGANDNTIECNVIGTSADGTTAAGNGVGVRIDSGRGNLVGSDLDETDDEAERNLISGNGTGVEINDGDGASIPLATGPETAPEKGDVEVFPNSVAGNLIGTRAGATSPIPNGVGIDLGTGEPSPGAVEVFGNLIAHSTIAGLRLGPTGAIGLVDGSQDNCLVGNAAGAVRLAPTIGVFELNWWGDASGPSGEGPGTGDSVSGGLDVDPFLAEPPPRCAPPAFDKSFAPGVVLPGGTSRLTFTIDNSGAVLAVGDLAFTDTLPSGVVVASPSNASHDCLAGSVVAPAGGGSISFSGGRVAAGGTCTVAVDTTSSTLGTHVNTSGDLTSDLGSSGTASDDLQVAVGHILVDKVTDPPGDATRFDFQLVGGPSGLEQSFSLADGDAPYDSGPILPGSGYSVVESVPDNWQLLSATCSNESPPTNISVTAGETVTCTFVDRNQAIEISKTPQVSPVVAGETGTFTIALRNAGATPLGNLQVTDPLSPDCDRDAGTLPGLAPGATTSYTCTTAPLFADLENVATVTADVPMGPPLVASASGRIEVIDPAITITKLPAAQQIQQGEAASFTITVTNVGDESLGNVAVTDPSTPDCRRDASEGSPGLLPPLGPGQSISYDCQTAPLAADLTNVATVSAETRNSTLVSASASAFVDVVQPIEIFKTPSEQQVAAGASADFTITISNPGNVAKTNVVVSDPASPDCETTIPNLAPMTSTSYDCTSPPLFGNLINVATVTALTPAGQVSAVAIARVTVLDPTIEIAKDPPAQLVAPGGVASFTITLRNPGTETLTGIAVSDPLTPDCARSAGSLPDLMAGAATVYACVTGPLVEDFTNVATATAGAASATATAFVNVTNPLEITKSPSEQAIPAGGEARFTITVSNNSDEVLENVAVADPLAPACARPAGTLPDLQPFGDSVTYVCASGPLEAGLTNVATATATRPGGGGYAAEASALALVLDPEITITKTPELQTIQAGLTATFTLTISNPSSTAKTDLTVTDPSTPDCRRGTIGETAYPALPDLGPGASTSYSCETAPLFADLENVATVSALGPDGGVSASSTAFVDVIVPIDVAKEPNEQSVAAGGIAVFTITVSNPGTVSKTNVIVSDPLTPDCDRSIGTLGPSESVAYTCQTAPLSGSLTNTAIVTGDSPAGQVTASDLARVTVLEPLIAVAKTPAAQIVDALATATFTISITNPGGDTLTGVAVSDPLTPDCNRPAGTLPDLQPRLSTSYTCQTGPLLADLTNVATVTAESVAGPIAASTSAFVNVRQELGIVKGPLDQRVPIGGTATFNITLVNDGETLESNVSVSDPASPDCDRPAGSLPDLQPRTSFVYTCVSPPLFADLTNVATVRASSPSGPLEASASAFAATAVSVKSFTGPTATGTGLATISFVGGGLADCGFTQAALVLVAGDPLSPPAGTAPAGVRFPHGLVTFRIGELCAPPGFVAELTFELPQVLAPDTQLWKYGPTPDDATPHWYVLPAIVDGNTLTYSITDGGLGDDDLIANGQIVDAGGPGNASILPIPALAPGRLALFVLLLALTGVLVLRRVLAAAG